MLFIGDNDMFDWGYVCFTQLLKSTRSRAFVWFVCAEQYNALWSNYQHYLHACTKIASRALKLIAKLFQFEWRVFYANF